MDPRATDPENQCSCKERKPVRAYCNVCKVYVCADCHVSKHIDHENDVIDLAEKCTRYLADYQKLSRAASLMADRRQVHIKDESIEGIIGEIREKILRAKETLQGDISKSTDQCLQYVSHSPLVQEFVRKKTELAEKADDPLFKLKLELGSLCKSLLYHISEGHFESADRLIVLDKLRQYEEDIKKLTTASQADVDFIQELHKLKQTAVEYSYNPLAVLGMIKVDTQVRKPNRVIQFDREKNVLNIFNIETGQLNPTTITAGFILPFRFVSVEACNNVYLNGGDNDHEQFLKSHYLYDELRGALVSLANMHEPRSRHALVAVDSKAAIYALGGDSAQGAKKTCERYDIKNNDWTLIHELHEPRSGLAACLVGSVIYAVGGWNNDYLDSVERLDTISDDRWELLKLSKKARLPPLQTPGLAVVKGDQLLVFGGYKEKEELSAEAMLLDTNTLAATKTTSLQEPEAFLSSESKAVGDAIYSFGYNKGGIHIFTVSTAQWSFVPQDQLPTKP